ncbi:integral membrane protein [Colletotrichum scovillei]|uniref:Integral membrane protein n=1 Tax=Colletotrichum scovillei TaxID=1209932 RepID=A0A9P7U9T1_9PEZI|nr:integral membrane protein [Colletotrichum scovillei]KAG7056260.1 integral membrane protein [Colletotrichum scovillei]KAG7066156.1 integral membrane protein [Colletotrichum scovillei]
MSSKSLAGLLGRNVSSTVPFVIDVSKDPAPRVVASIWAMISVSTVFLFCRVYCKKIRSRGLWTDDYLLVASWIFLLVSTSLTTELMRLGFGKSLDFSAHIFTLSSVNVVMNKVALALSKTSFAVTMLRIASGKLKVFIWFLIISMNAVLATSAVVAWKAACDRPSDSYEAVLPGSCWRVEDSVIMHMVSNAYSALVDFILSLLPWPMIWRLGLKRHEKIGVAVAMSLGVIAGLVGVIKVIKIVTIAEGADIPYRLSLLFIWGQAEINVTIVASSIPVLRVLFTEMYATSRSDERNGYLKSDGQSAFPTEIGMNTLEEGRKIEEETNRNVLLAMGPSTATNSAMKAHETGIGYNAMDEITQGTSRHTLRNSESYEGIELARALR